MKLRELFLGKPLHWLLWLVIIAVLYALGSDSLHVKRFIPFILTVLAMAAACVGIILATSRKGERITREPIDEP
jgi:uncharacterized membrane protein YdfJ with MMPL/SSD domain